MDYNSYKFSTRERIMYLGLGYLIGVGILFLFYRSVIISSIGGIGFSFVFIKYVRKIKIEKRKEGLVLEFKDAMDSMIAALSAGYSMDNAIIESYKDLMLMYNKETIMLTELKNIRQQMELKQPLDRLLLDFGRRSGIEDIITFSQIYATARKSGGNLIKVMKRTVDNISEKMEIQQEIQTAISGKKMEAMCMMVIPLFIIVYLNVFSPGFLNPLYQGIIGRGIMTAMLIVYFFAVLWSRSIMNIKG